ncbi:MAG: 30S ribosomal protein S8 [Candidatus Omnitrophica bacterium]|nr:30S ribosomal protein S8 [Candidatus Omnitrophota bacterium]
MAVLDPIANMLTIIRNAIDVRKDTVEIPASKMNEQILVIMKNDGYIEDVRLLKDKKQGILKVYLKYAGRKAVISGLKRISKSGLRVYVKNDEIPRVLSGLGTAIISTSKGIIDDKQARLLKTGGEVLCYVW